MNTGPWYYNLFLRYSLSNKIVYFQDKATTWLCVLVLLIWSIIIRQPVYNCRLYCSGESGNLFFFFFLSLRFFDVLEWSDAAQQHSCEIQQRQNLCKYRQEETKHINVIIFSGTWTDNRSQTQSSCFIIGMSIE